MQLSKHIHTCAETLGLEHQDKTGYRSINGSLTDMAFQHAVLQRLQWRNSQSARVNEMAEKDAHTQLHVCCLEQRHGWVDWMGKCDRSNKTNWNIVSVKTLNTSPPTE